MFSFVIAVSYLFITTDSITRAKHASAAELLLRLPKEVDKIDYGREFNTPEPITSSLNYPNRPTQPQKRGVVLLSSVEIPDRLLAICISAAAWSLYLGFEVEVIFLGPTSGLTKFMVGAATKYLESIKARVTFLDDIEIPKDIPRKSFVTSLRLFHYHWTMFSEDTIVYTADADTIPLHKSLYTERIPSECAWLAVEMQQVDEVISKLTTPNFALGDNIWTKGRSTALPRCQIEDQTGYYYKPNTQCYKGTMQMSFFGHAATMKMWRVMFPTKESTFSADLEATVRKVIADMDQPNSGFENTRVGFTDQALLIKNLVEFELNRDILGPRVCTKYRSLTLGTLYPTHEAMQKWMREPSEVKRSYLTYHHGPNRRESLRDVEWAFLDIVLREILPQEEVDEINALRVDVFMKGKH